MTSPPNRQTSSAMRLSSVAIHTPALPGTARAHSQLRWIRLLIAPSAPRRPTNGLPGNRVEANRAGIMIAKFADGTALAETNAHEVVNVDNADRNVRVHRRIALHHERAGNLIVVEELKGFLGERIGHDRLWTRRHDLTGSR